MNLGTARVIHGNALDLPLDDNTVDLVVTSPPYFGLRSYQDAGTHYSGQLGSEATPAEFVDALIAATREMVRVVKPSGSIFVNLGDKYAGAGRGNNKSAALNNTVEMMTSRLAGSNGRQHLGLETAPAKSLMGIPWRYALRCIDDLGLILRAEIIWAKPNGLPESVTDRVRRSHEQWFHFTLEPRYYSAVDEIREAHEGGGKGTSTAERKAAGWAPNRGTATGTQPMVTFAGNPLGKLPGSVWTIPTQPLTVPAELGVDHFAAFPMELPRRIITGWSPLGVCTVCGEGRRVVVDKVRTNGHRGVISGAAVFSPEGRFDTADGQRHMFQTVATITGYSCACDSDGYRTAQGLELPPTTPGLVLDPFGGTGTTALMAKALGRDGISVDLSEDYCRLARWRTTDPGQLAAALQVDKPAPVDPDQLDLFGEVSA